MTSHPHPHPHPHSHSHSHDHVAEAPPSDAAVGRSYRVHGMDCVDEVAVLKRALADLAPADALRFDVLNGRMQVVADVAEDRVIAAVAATGMRAEAWTTTRPAVSWWGQHERSVLAGVSGGATALGFGIHAALAGVTAAVGTEGLAVADGVPWAARVPYVVAIGAGVWVVVPKAAYALRSLRPDMNLLMTVAVVGALLLESWSVGRARSAVEKLLKLAPERVRVVRGGAEVEVAAADVLPGERFVVRAGERVALDGRVIAGASEVDQAPITGESVPVAKSVGSDVFAGTINGTGVLDVESTKAASDTTLAKIAALVGDAQAKRAASEQWVERFARVYTPTVVAVAALVAVVPPLVGAGAWEPWAYRALVLLVIGCPCALVISTPVSIVAALAAAARHGILVKGGRSVEIPASLRVIALDKTSTLTEGARWSSRS